LFFEKSPLTTSPICQPYSLFCFKEFKYPSTYSGGSTTNRPPDVSAEKPSNILKSLAYFSNLSIFLIKGIVCILN